MKILIIRFSSIGDIILTSPVVRCIKNSFPGSQLHYASKSEYSGLLKYNPNIDKIHLLRTKSLFCLISELRKENFDFIVDLHKNFRSVIIRTLLLKPSRSFNKLNFRKWLLVNFKINLLPDIHIVERYFQTVSKLGISNDGLGLDYFFPPDFNQNLPDKYSLIPNKYIGIVSGGKFFTKKYPAARWVEVINSLSRKVVLLGGKEEMNEATYIAGKTNALNLVGKTSLHESALILKLASKVITNDTGLMHIAAAFKKDIVSLWGNTIPQFGMYPYFGNLKSTSTVLEVSELSCRPCSKLGYKKKCPKGHFKCMNLIEAQQIVKALD